MFITDAQYISRALKWNSTLLLLIFKLSQFHVDECHLWRIKINNVNVVYRKMFLHGNTLQIVNLLKYIPYTGQLEQPKRRWPLQ